MSHPNPITIQVSAAEILSGDPTRVTEILESFVPDLLDAYRNRIMIEVSGLESDPREIFDVIEVRNYFVELFERNQGLFYWIDVSSHMLILLGLMVFEPWRSNGKVGLKPQDMKTYLIYGFSGLNEFCKKTGASPDATKNAITAQLRS